MTQESRYITEQDGKFVVHAEDGKVLGTHDTKAEAEKQLAAVEAHKEEEPARSIPGLPTLEIRTFPGIVRMEGDSEDPSKPPRISGYAAVFNSRSQKLRTDAGDEFVETIRPGTFARALGESDIRGLIDHDPKRILGRRSAGTLRVWEDAHGLGYEIDAPDVSYARDLAVSLKRGDISGSSFSFAVIDDAWGEGEDGMAVRELRSVHLFDVGPVAFPAYLATSAMCRSLGVYNESRTRLRYPTAEQVRLLNHLRLLELR